MGASDRALLGGFDLARCVAHWPAGPGWTLLDGDRVTGCGGFVAHGDEAVAWAILSDRLRSRPFALHRAAKRILAATAPRFRRIRATVVAGFADGHRWALALGFRPVRARPGHGPNGETFMEYER